MVGKYYARALSALVDNLQDFIFPLLAHLYAHESACCGIYERVRDGSALPAHEVGNLPCPCPATTNRSKGQSRQSPSSRAPMLASVPPRL